MNNKDFAAHNRHLGLTNPDQVARLVAMQDDMDALYEAGLPAKAEPPYMGVYRHITTGVVKEGGVPVRYKRRMVPA